MDLKSNKMDSNLSARKKMHPFDVLQKTKEPERISHPDSVSGDWSGGSCFMIHAQNQQCDKSKYMKHDMQGIWGHAVALRKKRMRVAKHGLIAGSPLCVG